MNLVVPPTVEELLTAKDVLTRVVRSGLYKKTDDSSFNIHASYLSSIAAEIKAEAAEEAKVEELAKAIRASIPAIAGRASWHESGHQHTYRKGAKELLSKYDITPKAVEEGDDDLW